jgi:hypothetical protein
MWRGSFIGLAALEEVSGWVRGSEWLGEIHEHDQCPYFNSSGGSVLAAAYRMMVHTPR